jgi:hypothetical protein
MRPEWGINVRISALLIVVPLVIVHAGKIPELINVHETHERLHVFH